MKKIFFLFSILLTTGIFAQKTFPEIISSERTFNLKNIKQNKIIKHDFFIKNIGTAVLKIKDVKTSCECTAVQPLKKIIEPGDSVKITAEFNTINKIGFQRHHVYIFSNDPKNPEYRLTLTGNVILSKEEEQNLPKIKLPYSVYDFGNVKQGKILKHFIEIKNVGKETLKIKKIKTGCKFLKLKLKKKKLKYNKTSKLKLKLNTKNLSGKQSCIVTIKSNDPRTRVAIITITANVIK